MRLLTLILAAGAALAATGAAHAATTTVDFNDKANGGSFVQAGPVYASQDYRFTSSMDTDSAFVFWGVSNSSNANPGGTTLGFNLGGETVTVDRADGGTFDLVSLDMADIFNQAIGGEVSFTFRDSNGTSALSLNLADTTGLQHFVVNKTGLLSFSITPVTTYGKWLQIDNVVLGDAGVGAVPEPATWAMMVGGFALAGSAARRRSRGHALA